MTADLIWRPPAAGLPPWSAADPGDKRLGHLLQAEVDDRTQVVLIGFPSDLGVERNHGRIGAREGPSSIRSVLYRLTPAPDPGDPHRRLLERTADLGDLELGGDLEEDQDRLAMAVAEALAGGRLPVVLGGGHETTFGHFLGYARLEREVSLLNWDAHPDVRPLIEGRGHSGSPFRQALEHDSRLCRGYRVAGLLPHSVAGSHIEYLKTQGGSCIWKRELGVAKIEEAYRSLSSPLLVSFDLDAVDQSLAPGVSAPAVGGMDAELWLHAVRCAGSHLGTTSVDLVELNPRHDRDHQTARLAALTVWELLRARASALIDGQSAGSDHSEPADTS